MMQILAFSKNINPSAIVGVIEPLDFLKKKGFIRFEYKKSEEIHIQDIREANILVCIRGSEKTEIAHIEEACRHHKYCVYFLDDDLLNIDGIETYNQKYYRNPQVIRNINEAMEKCHCLWTTNSLIASRYERQLRQVFVTNAPALLLQNQERKKTNQSYLTIGFTGGMDHRSTVEKLLFEPFEGLLKKYSDTLKIEIVGFEPYYLRSFPIEFYPYIEDFSQYKSFMKHRNWDIGLAPLQQSSFNACKYFNKYLEYGGMEAAGIFSNEKPFSQIIRSGENGLLVPNKSEDWYHAILLLIENERLRNHLIDGAKQDLIKNFQLEKVALEVYQALLILVR